MKKIYIAGRISEECETPELMKKCFHKFESYGLSIIDTSIGYTTNISNTRYYCDLHYNVGYTHGLIINFEILGKGTWEEYMKNDISILIRCDEIHLLPDWKESKGAIIERNLAISLNIPIIYI